MKIIFHPEASEEKLESARFYEARVEGLGADFLDAVQQATDRILQFSEGRSHRTSRYTKAIGCRLSFLGPLSRRRR